MRDPLARLAAWGRRALVVGALATGALVAAPVAAPAQAQLIPAVMVEGPGAELVPVQYYGRPPRHYRRHHRHWHRPPPPPRYYHRRHYQRGYPPPPPRYYRY